MREIQILDKTVDENSLVRQNKTSHDPNGLQHSARVIMNSSNTVENPRKRTD